MFLKLIYHFNIEHYINNNQYYQLYNNDLLERLHSYR